MDQGELGFRDAQFWEDFGENEQRLVEDFGERDFEGLVLDGPQQVELESRSDLPLVGVRASSIRDNVMVSLQRRLLVVASRLDSDEVCAGTAFRINDDARRPPKPKDESAIPKGRTVKAFRILANDRIEDLPWRPGTLQAQLLLFDRRSNPVTARLVGKEPSDPAVREFLAAQRRPAYPPAIAPAIPRAVGRARQLPNPYQRRADSPAVPAEPGIALASERVVVHRAGAKCELRGSYLLPVLERDRVRPPPAPQPGEDAEQAFARVGWVDVGDDSATAVLPITLLLTGDTVADPITVDLKVPVYGAVSRGAASGHFAVDLFGLVPELEAQTYAVWAISRAVVSEPVLLGVVTEDMLPPPGER